MKAQLARIVEVVSGHSVRARVHAISESGLELKIEVPLEEAEGLAAGQVLWIAWSAHALPDCPAPRTSPQAAHVEVVPGPSASHSVDAALSELVADKRHQNDPIAPSTASRSLADLLGLRFDSSADCT